MTRRLGIVLAAILAAAVGVPATGAAMEKVVGVGGVFFRAKDPKALAAWYKAHLGVEAGGGPWATEAGTTVIAPFPQDTGYFGRPEQQWMINFRVRDMDAMIAQLKAAGVAVETRKEWDSAEYGRFAPHPRPGRQPRRALGTAAGFGREVRAAWT
ncbi:MAG: VOC family protein [Caulobacteraceae bacterium]